MKFEELSQVSSYVSERIRIDEVNLDNYVSTENMISERGGVTKATKLPSGKTISVFQKGDILISNIRPYFKKIWLADKSGGCSNDVLVVRANEKISNRFLYYVLSSDNFFDYAVGTSKGTKMPRGDKKAIMKYKVPIYSLVEQEKIAEVLRAFDKKIILNKQINHHLEQIAQAIFKSWFVDFEPFGGKMPNDWTIGKLSDVLKLIKNGINDKDKQKLPYVPIDILPMHSLSLNSYKSNDEAKSSLITFKKNDILLGAMRVYFHRVCISPFTGITRSTCFVLRPFNKIYLEYCLLTCNLKSSIEYAQSTSKGSTMPYAVWENGLAELKIPIPTEKVIKNFSKIVSPLIKTLQDSIYEIENLQNLRDTLLPKLLSGEISVNQATK
ncbi:restriction endonuclease subunit S [Streptococcus sp. 27098_8_73]|uniref:restriction endonuclease subunit S n=1 Tax=Streptococcus sp. 27098_8_73 TaxID=3003668 RepID=UPI00352FC877